MTQEVQYLLKMTAKFFECGYGDGVGVLKGFSLWDDKQTRLRGDGYSSSKYISWRLRWNTRPSTRYEPMTSLIWIVGPKGKADDEP